MGAQMQFRKTLLAMAFGLVAGNAMAQTVPLSGDFYLGGQFTSWGGDAYSAPESGTGAVFGARILVPAGPQLAFQFEAAGETTPTLESLTQAFAVGGHALFILNDQFEIGVFGALSSAVIDEGEDFTGFFGGIEGAADLNNTRLFVQGGMAHADEDGTEDVDFFFARTGVRQFFTDNLRGDIDLTAAQGTFYGDTDAAMVSIGAGIEMKLDDKPISFFARVESNTYFLDICPDIGTEQRAMAGVRFAIDGDTLKDLPTFDLPRMQHIGVIDVLEYNDC